MYNSKAKKDCQQKNKKKVLFFKKIFQMSVSICYKDLLINHFKLKCVNIVFFLKKHYISTIFH